MNWRGEPRLRVVLDEHSGPALPSRASTDDVVARALQRVANETATRAIRSRRSRWLLPSVTGLGALAALSVFVVRSPATPVMSRLPVSGPKVASTKAVERLTLTQPPSAPLSDDSSVHPERSRRRSGPGDVFVQLAQVRRDLNRGVEGSAQALVRIHGLLARKQPRAIDEASRWLRAEAYARLGRVHQEREALQDLLSRYADTPLRGRIERRLSATTQVAAAKRAPTEFTGVTRSVLASLYLELDAESSYRRESLLRSGSLDAKERENMMNGKLGSTLILASLLAAPVTAIAAEEKPESAEIDKLREQAKAEADKAKADAEKQAQAAKAEADKAKAEAEKAAATAKAEAEKAKADAKAQADKARAEGQAAADKAKAEGEKAAAAAKAEADKARAEGEKAAAAAKADAEKARGEAEKAAAAAKADAEKAQAAAKAEADKARAEGEKAAAAAKAEAEKARAAAGG